MGSLLEFSSWAIAGKFLTASVEGKTRNEWRFVEKKIIFHLGNLIRLRNPYRN